MTGGGAVLSDDDLSEEATFKGGIWGCDNAYTTMAVLDPPDLDAMELRYGPAYIAPVHDTDVSRAVSVR